MSRSFASSIDPKAKPAAPKRVPSPQRRPSPSRSRLPSPPRRPSPSRSRLPSPSRAPRPATAPPKTPSRASPKPKPSPKAERVVSPRRGRELAPAPGWKILPFPSNKQAMEYITTRLPKIVTHARKPPAIVLDIDGTTLYNHHGSNACHRSLACQNMYQEAHRLGVAIFFVTARPDDPAGRNRKITVDELTKLGFSGWQELYMCPERAGNPSRFKAQSRAEIAKHYTILVNAGDAHGDITELPSNSERGLTQKQAFVESLSSRKAYVLRFPGDTSLLHIKLCNEK